MSVAYGGTVLTGNRTISYDVWSDVAVSYNGEELSILIDGKIDKKVSLSVAPVIKDDLIQIGNRLSQGRAEKGKGFRGFIDIVALFNIPLAESASKMIDTPEWDNGKASSEAITDNDDGDNIDAVVPWDIYDGCVVLPSANGGYRFSEGLPFTKVDS